MSATSRALAPARHGTFARQGRNSTRVVIASVAVAAAIVLAAAAVAMSQGSAAPVAAQGGTGHSAPMTSAFERAIEARSAVSVATDAATGTLTTIGPSALTVDSGATGLAARVPSASSPMEQAIESRLGSGTAVAQTIVLTGATGLAARVPSATSPMEQAVESQSDAGTVTPTVLITSASGLDHRLPLR